MSPPKSTGSTKPLFSQRGCCSGGQGVRTLILGWLLFAIFTGLAKAHTPFESWTDAQLRSGTVELHVTLSRVAAGLLLEDSASRSALFNDAQFNLARPALLLQATNLYAVAVDGVPLATREIDVQLAAENDVDFQLVYPCPAGQKLKLQATYLEKMLDGHKATLVVYDEADKLRKWDMLSIENPSLEVELSPILPESKTPPVAPLFQKFLVLGVEHILLGFDHLLFLAGLLVVCRRFSSMALIVTCFTVAHSITLALAALDVVSLPSRVVEPLIAASIVFVGVENLVRREAPKGRWALTFAFGLIHGFGFAAVLQKIGLGKEGASLLVPLFSFNFGVELGQIAVASVFLPVLWQLQKKPAFLRYGLPAISAGVALLGAYWFAERVFWP